MSFGGFIENIKKAALEHVDDETKARLSKVIDPPRGQIHLSRSGAAAVGQDLDCRRFDRRGDDDHGKPNFQRGKRCLRRPSATSVIAWACKEGSWVRI